MDEFTGHAPADAIDELMMDTDQDRNNHGSWLNPRTFFPIVVLVAIIYMFYKRRKPYDNRPRLSPGYAKPEFAEELRRKRLERLEQTINSEDSQKKQKLAHLSKERQGQKVQQNVTSKVVKQKEPASQIAEVSPSQPQVTTRPLESRAIAREPSIPASSEDKANIVEENVAEERADGQTDVQKQANRTNQIISMILNATLTETLTKKKDSKGPSQYLLPKLSAELQAEGQALLLSSFHIDSALTEVLEQLSPRQALQYLLDAYTRARKELRSPSTLVGPIEDTIRCIVTQAGLMLQNTPLFRLQQRSADHLALLLLPYLEAAPSDGFELPNHFLEQLAQQFEDEDLNVLLEPIFAHLRKAAETKTLLDQFIPHLRALALLTKERPIAKAMIRLPNWQPLLRIPNGRDIELRSYLGPFFHFTSFPENPAVAQAYFSNSLQRTRDDVNGSYLIIRSVLNPAQALLHDIIMNLIKSGETREAALCWIANALAANRGRTRIQVDRFSVSSEGFMLNLGSVMLRACQPFTAGIKDEKIKLIDSSYYLFTTRIDTSHETRLSASVEDVNAWISTQKKKNEKPPTDAFEKEDSEAVAETKKDFSGSFGFVTEAFFLTHYCLHVGLVRTCSMFSNFHQAMARVHKKIQDLEHTMPQWQNSPQAVQMRATLDNAKKQLEAMHKAKLAMEAHLLDPQLLQSALNFYAFSSKWLCHLVDKEKKGLPLAPPEIEFSTLPEFLVDDMIAFVLFVLRFSPDAISTSMAASSIVDFLVLFLGSNQHIKNPYLRSQLVEVLYEFSPDAERDALRSERKAHLPFVFHQIDSNPTAIKYLTPALIKLYVDIETTGRHAQFYDKFFARRHIALLLKYLRVLPQYEGAMEATSKNTSLFLQFANMLVNDATYLLDEVLIKLGEIHTIERAMQDRETWESQPEEVRAEREQTLSQYEGYTSTFGILSNETVLLLLYLSEKAPKTFLRPEMIDRVAVMLNYYLIELSSSKCQEIQVWDPAKYKFTPKEWLKRIIEIYLNFARHGGFKKAVQRDGRSFKPDTFRKIVAMLKDQMIMPLKDIERFSRFVDEASAYYDQQQKMQEDVGEIPEEFLDPITFELMEDPVILPTSNNTMDRSAITRHLLSDPIDPFNRAPLTIDMLQPNTELKAKIKKWMEDKLASRVVPGEGEK